MWIEPQVKALHFNAKAQRFKAQRARLLTLDLLDFLTFQLAQAKCFPLRFSSLEGWGKALSLGSIPELIAGPVRKRYFAPPNPDIVVALRLEQIDNVRRNSPMLLAVGALNALIVMAVCANSGMPLAQYGWIGALAAYCLLRIIFLRRAIGRKLSPDEIPGQLRKATAMPVLVVAFLGCFGSFSFITQMFNFELMVPVSLAFGTMAIAQCLYTLRFAAVATLILGITPVAAALVFTGSFDAQMLGAAMLSIVILMVRFVLQQFDVLVERVTIEQEFRTFANTDALTEIANRRATMAEMKTMIEGREPFAVALLDLDDFKQINDRLGHNTGDCVLQEVARRLSKAVGPDDTVGRLGGDEFLAIFRNISGGNDVSARATAILANLCQPIDTGEHIVPVGACLGYASYPGEAATLADLLHAADMALYTQKRAGRADTGDERKIA